MNLTGHFSTYGLQHTILSGFDYYQNDRAGALQTLTFPATSINVFTGATNPNTPPSFNGVPLRLTDYLNSWYGLYLQDQVDITDQLHLLLGGRYDNTDSFFGTAGQTRNKNTDKLNPRYGIVYQPWKFLSLYGHYVESMGGMINGQSFDGKLFDPETATEYEGGIKVELLDGQFSGTLAYFDLTKQNVLTPDPAPGIPF
ncbi:MAG: TonB-dependent receptor [Methylococcaceae bacterium]|nr:TonB-dependent receptor [Methylococcaceae bacterium]